MRTSKPKPGDGAGVGDLQTSLYEHSRLDCLFTQHSDRVEYMISPLSFDMSSYPLEQLPLLKYHNRSSHFVGCVVPEGEGSGVSGVVFLTGEGLGVSSGKGSSVGSGVGFW